MKTVNDMLELSERLPAQRAVKRFGAERVWTAVDTSRRTFRRVAWARALVRATAKPEGWCEAAYLTLVHLQPTLDRIGIHPDGDYSKEMVIEEEESSDLG